MIDVIFAGGLVIDGSGTPGIRADVAVEGDSIIAIGDLRATSARRRINVFGRVATPGFIDIHTHADFTILAAPGAESQIRQGVTTNVVGNCGFSPFPADPTRVDDLRAITTYLDAGLPYSWSDLERYAAEVESGRPAINVAPQVGHSVVRLMAMGFAERAPTPREQDAMRRLVAAAMEQGAFGLSSGLIYAPGASAGIEELADLAAVAGRFGGFYSSHLRNEGDRLLEAMEETLEVGRRASVPVQFSHHKASGPPNWGKVRDSLARIDRARKAGYDVLADQYPYAASSTLLSTTLPRWAQAGGNAAIVARLNDPEQRARIAAEMATRHGEAGWARIVATGLDGVVRRFDGQRLTDIAVSLGVPTVEAVFALLIATEGRAAMVNFSLSEEDVELVMRHPAVMIGSDGWTLSPSLGGTPHPRSYGTFARVIGHYVNERRILSLEEAVRKATSLPARRLGLTDRGRIAPGCRADLAVFAPEQVRERATYREPHQFAEGVEFVMVNGVMTLDSGEITGKTAGQVLRRSGSS